MASTARGERRRAALVDAAAAILLVEGLEGVSHRAVAEKARVPLGATTYYFGTLDDLRRAARDRIVGRELARMERAVAKVRPRRRSSRATAAAVVDLLTPGGRADVVAWYERYVRSAREPLLREGARATNEAACRHVATVLDRSGWNVAVPAHIALALVDGCVVGALVEGVTIARVRAAARDALMVLLDLSAGAVR